jgi:hypothetical protein
MVKFSRSINVVGDKCKEYSKRAIVQWDVNFIRPLGVIKVMRFVSSVSLREGSRTVHQDRAV